MIRTSHAGWALGLASLLVAACGGGNASNGAPAVSVTTNVSITILPAIDPLPYNPYAARIVQATNDLQGVVGHGVELRFDQALIPQWQANFENALGDSLESMTKALVWMRKTNPAAFAREVPALRRIDCHYSATVDENDRNEAKFAGGIVTIAESAETRWLVSGDDVVNALEDRFLEDAEARFGDREPDQIAPTERAEYLAFITSSQRSDAARDRERAAEKAGKRRIDSRAPEILRLTKLASIVGASDTKLASDIRAALAGNASYVMSETIFRKGSPEAADGSTERRAQAAYVAWMNAVMGTPSMLTPEQRLEVATAVYERDTPLPGFDDLAFGLGVVDEWTNAGRPTTGDEKDAHFALLDLVVCPVGFDARGNVNRNRGCRDGWLKHALQSNGDTKRLGDALGKRNDRQLVDGMIYELQYGKQEVLTRFLRALEPYPRVWQSAVRTVLERLGAHPSIDEDEAMRIWRERPEYRGSALYIFAFHHSESRHYADEHFERARKNGLPIDASTFGAFLDQGPGTFALVPTVWRAMTPGWSRADVISSHLPRLFEDPLPPSPTYGKPEAALETIMQRLCDDKATADIARLHQAFVARAAAHPENARALENVIADSAVPARCAVVGTKKDDDDDVFDRHN